MSKFSARGLSILVSVPLIQGNDVVESITDKVNSYSHTISANGGFTSADFNLTGNNEYIENWFQYGLGRHIQVFGPSGQIIWEGYVNQIDINAGYATYTRGPLTSVANRVCVWYTPIGVDPDTGLPFNPKITYTAHPTYIEEDLLSQSRYGIWEKVVNIGEVTDEDAAYIRGLFLYENSSPEGNPALNISGSEGEFSASIKCRGYVDWIDNYIYEYDNGTETCVSLWASEKIKTILTAEPNNVISSLYDKIDDNPVLTCDNETEYKTAKSIIDDILTFGGGDDDRWTFGIYTNRKAVYSAIPTQVEYVYYKTGRTQQVETLAGTVLDPWEVVPCKWAIIPSFLTGLGVQVNNPRNDPRAFFVEEVSFTAPDEVTLSGAKIRKLPQLLAKLGLGGT